MDNELMTFMSSQMNDIEYHHIMRKSYNKLKMWVNVRILLRLDRLLS